jgi:hypothetical protein
MLCCCIPRGRRDLRSGVWPMERYVPLLSYFFCSQLWSSRNAKLWGEAQSFPPKS